MTVTEYTILTAGVAIVGYQTFEFLDLIQAQIFNLIIFAK